MDDAAAETKLVTVTPADPRFAFEVRVPSEWVQVPLPDETTDFASTDSFQPVAVFSAPYGAVVLTLSVRPALEGASVAEWLMRLSVAQGIEFSEIGPGAAGEIPGVAALGSQPSQMGPMTIRVVMFEQGGWAHTLLGMAPAAVWGSLGATFDAIFASFAMLNAEPQTVPAWPPDELAPDDSEAEEPAAEDTAVESLPPAAEEEAPESVIVLSAEELAEARQTAERFLGALQKGDEAAARELLGGEDDGSVSFPMAGKGDVEFELGEPQADGARAIVEAKLRSRPSEAAEPEEQVIPLVLERTGTEWRVNMGASIERMLGFDLEDCMTDLAEGFGKAVTGFAEG
ncbi:MAG: hypothetical protein JXQ29_10245, partial [Planctomycetes bacterium]|nr:hypothetical protein [Planctomycetota bacterium]